MLNGRLRGARGLLGSVSRNIRHRSNPALKLERKIPDLPVPSTPDQCYSQIHELKKNKDLKSIWKLTKKMKSLNIPLNIDIYFQLMNWFSLPSSENYTKEAIETFDEAMNQYKFEESKVLRPLSQEEKIMLSQYLLICLNKSSDFTDIAILNLFWENYMSILDNENLEILYHSAYVNILFNTHQNNSAFEYFEHLIANYLQTSSLPSCQILNRLPVNRFIGLLISNKDCDSLNKWLDVILEAESLEKSSSSKIDGATWVHVLTVALSQNHYDLTKNVYDNFIMKQFRNSAISIEDAIFKPVYHTSTLNSFTDELILQILHTFSTHGDVNLTLSLIESLFLHKFVQGEKALTKELCIKILEAYCYNPELKANWDGNEIKDYKNIDDESIMGVLGVLNGFITKFKQDGTKLYYNDISASLSFKFWNYQSYDKNIEHSINRQKAIEQKIESLEENRFESKILPKKMSNTNISSSRFGNTFANMTTLEKFVESHFQFLQENTKFHQETITVFLNCLLNHLFLHQNFTAAIRVLLVLKRVNPDFGNWLDEDLFLLLFKLMGNGTATKRCSIVLYEHLKQKRNLIPEQIFIQILEANFRGYCHDAVQYIMYEYLTTFNSILRQILETLSNLPSKVVEENEGTQQLMIYCNNSVDFSLESVNSFWKQHNLCWQLDKIEYDKQSSLKREYRSPYDIRDAESIRHIFSIS